MQQLERTARSSPASALRPRRPGFRAIAALVTATVVVAASAYCGADASSPPHAGTLARRFIHTYVTADGRVIRRDQGGDIVSEGQAYAMVLAEVASDAGTVRRVWRWTASHLQRPDALLAWHSDSHGRVLDRQSAADADVLAAYALLRYRGPDSSTLSAAGRRLAGAVWRHETVTVNRRRVLVAGPWAAGSHPTFNPSYWMPSVFRWIGTETSESRWRRLAKTSVALLSELSQNGNRLPPDWAHVVAGRMVPMKTPGTNQSPRYGLEAERSPAWLAADCSASGRSLAAKWSGIIGGDSTASASLSRGLHGRVLDSTRMPLPMAGAAAAAAAAGHDEQSNQLLESAVSQEQEYPTYYGAAWVALGAALVNGHAPACASS